MKQQNEERKERIRKAFTDASQVVEIPATEVPQNIYNRKLTVAAYCRVSTLQEQQSESYEVQRQYYEQYIQNNENWTLYGIYADEGLSATSVRKRKKFLELMEECKRGKLDLIVTKSVSRFARNTVDCLSYARMLLSLPRPVGVLFETNAINTLTQGEMQLTTWASFAQHESEEKSTSIKWGIRQRFRHGLPHFTRCLGYEITDHRPIIIDDEAEVVRLIYQMFLDGYNFSQIARALNESNYRTIRANEWYYGAIQYILTNEIYRGDALMQKFVTVSVLTHKSVRNTGQVEQYYLPNSHDPIIDAEVWDEVQELLKSKKRVKYSNPDFDSLFVPYDTGHPSLQGYQAIKPYMPQPERKWKNGSQPE